MAGAAHAERARDAAVQTARTAVDTASAGAGSAVGRSGDRRLFAGADDCFGVGADVAEGVSDADLDRLVVGDEFEFAGGLHALIDVVVEEALKFGVQQFSKH